VGRNDSERLFAAFCLALSGAIFGMRGKNDLFLLDLELCVFLFTWA
jgi:hypothetical protein